MAYYNIIFPPPYKREKNTFGYNLDRDTLDSDVQKIDLNLKLFKWEKRILLLQQVGRETVEPSPRVLINNPLVPASIFSSALMPAFFLFACCQSKWKPHWLAEKTPLIYHGLRRWYYCLWWQYRRTNTIRRLLASQNQIERVPSALLGKAYISLLFAYWMLMFSLEFWLAFFLSAFHSVGSRRPFQQTCKASQGNVISIFCSGGGLRDG